MGVEGNRHTNDDTRDVMISLLSVLLCHLRFMLLSRINPTPMEKKKGVSIRSDHSQEQDRRAHLGRMKTPLNVSVRDILMIQGIHAGWNRYGLKNRKNGWLRYAAVDAPHNSLSIYKYTSNRRMWQKSTKPFPKCVSDMMWFSSLALAVIVSGHRGCNIAAQRFHKQGATLFCVRRGNLFALWWLSSWCS